MLIAIVCKPNQNWMNSKIMADIANIDIIAVSETWLKDNDNDISFQIAGFQNIIRCDRAKHASGGVAVYCHDNINFTQRYDLCQCILPDDSFCVWIEVCLDKSKLLIGTYYRPPGQSAQKRIPFWKPCHYPSMEHLSPMLPLLLSWGTSMTDVRNGINLTLIVNLAFDFST